MSRYLPKDLIDVANDESLGLSERGLRIRTMADRLPWDDTFDCGLTPWGNDQAAKIYFRTDFRAERMTLLGHFAMHEQYDFMQALLESATSPRENPAAFQTPIGSVGLIDYLCMVAKPNHLAPLATACRTLQLQAEHLQPIVDRVFGPEVWKTKHNKLQVGQILVEHGSYVHTMGILAARGAQLAPAVWATPKTDLLVRFMAQPFLDRVGRTKSNIELRRDAVQALAQQGFGRRISVHDNCPVYFAAKSNDPELLGALIASGLHADRKGPSGTALECLDLQDRLKTGSSADERKRCRDILQVAAAHKAARLALDELDDHPSDVLKNNRKNKP